MFTSRLPHRGHTRRRPSRQGEAETPCPHQRLRAEIGDILTLKGAIDGSIFFVSQKRCFV
jgi:hypothetical protein